MSERYRAELELPKNLYSETSPVTVTRAAVIKDLQKGYLFAELIFLCICPKTIRSLSVCVTPLNSAGSACGSSAEHIYDGIWAARDMDFGGKVLIPLNVKSAASLSFDIKEIVFTDNTVWSGCGASWDPLPEQNLLEKEYGRAELAVEYKLAFGSECEFALLETADLWLCTCGHINRSGEEKCHRCNKSRSALAAITPEVLNQRLTARLKKEAAEKPKFEEAYIAVQNDEKAKKRRIMIYIMVLAVVITVIAMLIAVDNDHYTVAMEAPVSENISTDL